MRQVERSSIVQSIIDDAARNAVMVEAAGRCTPASTTAGADSFGPGLLLDAVDPDGARFIRRYCEWLSRGDVDDAHIAARFDRSLRRLQRMARQGELALNDSDRPGHWNGAVPQVIVIQAVLKTWARDHRLSEREKLILHICIKECRARTSGIREITSMNLSES